MQKLFWLERGRWVESLVSSFHIVHGVYGRRPIFKKKVSLSHPPNEAKDLYFHLVLRAKCSTVEPP